MRQAHAEKQKVLPLFSTFSISHTFPHFQQNIQTNSNTFKPEAALGFSQNPLPISTAVYLFLGKNFGVATVTNMIRVIKKVVFYVGISTVSI